MPFQNVQIVSTLVEPVDSVSVVEGDHVSKGQVLAQLDTKDLEAQLQSLNGTIASDEAKTKQTVLQSGLTIAQNSNSINSAHATVRQAQQTLANDTDELESRRAADQTRLPLAASLRYATRARGQRRAGRALGASRVAEHANASADERHDVDAACKARRSQSVKADEQVAQGQAQQVRVQIAKATIVSPIDGVVVNRNLNPGEYPGTRQLFTLQQTDKVYAVLNGAGAEIVGVQVGSPVKIVSSDRATLKGDAKVSAVLDQVTPGSTNFVVKAVLPNPGDAVPLGHGRHRTRLASDDDAACAFRAPRSTTTRKRRCRRSSRRRRRPPARRAADAVAQADAGRRRSRGAVRAAAAVPPARSKRFPSSWSPKTTSTPWCKA